VRTLGFPKPSRAKFSIHAEARHEGGLGSLTAARLRSATSPSLSARDYSARDLAGLVTVIPRSTPSEPKPAKWSGSCDDTFPLCSSIGALWSSASPMYPIRGRSARARVTQVAGPWPCTPPADRDEVGPSPGLIVGWIFEFGWGSSKAEHGPLIMPGKRQMGVLEQLFRRQIARCCPSRIAWVRSGAR